MTVREIAISLLAATSLNEEALAPLREYRRAKRETGAPVNLESAVTSAARKCEEAEDDLRAYLAKAAKEAAEALAGLDAVGSRLNRTWFYLEPRQNAEALNGRMIAARCAFDDTVELWVALSDRVVATPEESAAKEAERVQAAAAKRAEPRATESQLSVPGRGWPVSASRWVRKEAREWPYGRDGCPACGSARCGSQLCQAATCRACGSVVCLHSCGSRGQCPVCLYGLVEGWSHMGARCGYAGCAEALSPVAAAPRVGYVCRAHLDRAKLHIRGIDRVKRTLSLAAYVAEMLSTRAARFVEVAP